LLAVVLPVLMVQRVVEVALEVIELLQEYHLQHHYRMP
jgi:hypothetical protein